MIPRRIMHADQTPVPRFVVNPQQVEVMEFGLMEPSIVLGVVCKTVTYDTIILTLITKGILSTA